MARKPKIQPGAAAEAAMPVAEPVAADAAPAPVRRGRKPKQPAGPTAASASQVDDAAGGGPPQPDADSGGSTVEAAQPSAEMDAPTPTRPAARWDQDTGMVRFDWPEIERTAAQEGPNQGTAKLLVAARAEGANSRWPL